MQGPNITIVIDGQPHTISKAHVFHTQILEAVKKQDWEEVKSLVDPRAQMINYTNGNLSIVYDEMFWNGKPIHNVITDRIIDMIREGFNVDPLVKFMTNMMGNPSYRAVQELYKFLEAGKLPITPDGYFLAYKKVRADYLDVHSGTIDNSVGKSVFMPRNEVNDNSQQTCSHGLHFCSHDYLRNFGGERIMVLKINPADVVSIPADYSDTKGRCCAYQVVDEITSEDVRAKLDATVVDETDQDWLNR
jgi:hypothetical protein